MFDWFVSHAFQINKLEFHVFFTKDEYLTLRCVDLKNNGNYVNMSLPLLREASVHNYPPNTAS